MDLRLADATRESVVQAARPIERLDLAQWPARIESLTPAQRAQIVQSGFEPEEGAHALIFDAAGTMERVLYIAPASPRASLEFGRLAVELPSGIYRLSEPRPEDAMDALAFLLGGYSFDYYRASKPRNSRLLAPADVDSADIERVANAVARGRDLINRPANDMGPSELEAACLELARRHDGRASVHRGQELLQAGLPLVLAVGRAGAQAPRLVDLRWESPQAQLSVTLVGKGVCFDTGGLDLKPASAMALMKKDMGGAAAAMAAADMIMGARLPVRLRLIVPIVENAISGEAFRPGDVLRARNGLSVEIGNTDAEGRLILADALTMAVEESPDVLIDVATLTGAARTALGPDVPAFFTDDEDLAAQIAQSAARVADPAWRLPLWSPYERQLKSKIADLNNIASSNFAGAIMAALFLQKFVKTAKSWAHFDIYGWSPAARPGRPEGGDPQAARLIYDLVCARVKS